MDTQDEILQGLMGNMRNPPRNLMADMLRGLTPQQMQQQGQPQPGPRDFDARRAEIEKRRQMYEAERAQASAPPDTSAMDAYGKQRGQQGGMHLLKAMAAQQAGMGEMQRHFLGQAGESAKDIDTDSGRITNQGFIPDAAKERLFRLKNADIQLAAVDRAENMNLDAEQRAWLADEKLKYQRQRDQEMDALRREGFANSKAIANIAAGGKSSGDEGSGFAGPSTVVGTDPRTQMPVHRNTKSGLLFAYGPDGKPVKYESPMTPKDVSESERASGGYAARAGDANKQLIDMGERGKAGAIPQAIEKVPLIGDLLRRAVETKDQTLRRTAEVEFARAKLRAESGAVISDKEAIEEARSLFAQPGDDDVTVSYKGTLRDNAVRALNLKAGRATGGAGNAPASAPNNDPLGIRR